MSEPAPVRAVILVHGFASSYEHNWVRTGWLDALEGRGHRVLGLDLPGHGGNARAGNARAGNARAGNAQAGGALAAVGQLAELADLYPEVDLVGFSAGARVCALAAASGQVTVRRLVLAGLGDGVLAGGDNVTEQEPISLTGPLDDADVRSRLFRRMAASAGNDPRALEDYLAAPAGELTAEVLARIACPTLVIMGERDHLGPASQITSSLPDSRLVTLPQTDHFATPGHVEAILAALRFLSD